MPLSLPWQLWDCSAPEVGVGGKGTYAFGILAPSAVPLPRCVRCFGKLLRTLGFMPVSVLLQPPVNSAWFKVNIFRKHHCSESNVFWCPGCFLQGVRVWEMAPLNLI